MGLYSADELADARADYADAMFDKQAQLMKQGGASREGGGWDDTPVAFGDPLPCRLVTPRIRAHESDVAGKVASQTRLYIELPATVDVPADYQIALVGGATYRVIGTDAGRSDALRTSVEVVKVK